ncbi:MAG: stage IV sporulation protein A [Eubacteriales bacterium]
MTDLAIYKNIAERTSGDIYIGVVGPVRTGKSTFIKRFMETLVLPNMTDPYGKERARDEMPQSAAGKTVMTTEPKFIPDEAVEIKLPENTSFKVKMIDCVGYVVPGAIGYYEDGNARMVMTPWSNNAMPFDMAAEMGTKKVINEHSTIGMVVTTDGTFGDIPRANYIDAEQRVVNELKQINKPFVIVLNSAYPEKEESVALAYQLEDKYNVPVALVNCLDLSDEDIKSIIEMVLFEFPIKEIAVNMPDWINSLEPNHWLNASIKESIMKCANNSSKVGEIKTVFKQMSDNANIRDFKTNKISLGQGTAEISIELDSGMYYKIMSEMTGFEINSEQDIMPLLKKLSVIKTRYDKVAPALDAVENKGYGIVLPGVDDLTLEEPEIVRQSGGYGVKLRASAPSIHMVKANIQTEISPIVGSEKQSEDLVKFLLHDYEENPRMIWESNIFGKSLHELVNEGLNTKLAHMPEEAQGKLSETLQRIINEGSNGLICIIL